MTTSVVTIREVDLDDEAGVRAWHSVEQEVHDLERPDSPLWSADDVVAWLRPDDPLERAVPFVAEADGRMVGSGGVFVPLRDNTDKVYAFFQVLPDERGHGVGSLLAEHVIDVARREGRDLVLLMAHLPIDHDANHPVRRFAERHGFSLANQEIRRCQRLPVPEEQLQAWADEAAPHHGGYEIATYEGVVPEELQQSLVDLQNLLAVDAPTGDVDFEAEASTVETYRLHAERTASSGRRTYETVAVRDGEVVAQTTLSVPPPGKSLPFIDQWGTYVHRAHRGHRLGLAVKVANLRRVQREHPERTMISTTNSTENGPMIAINEHMGFRPVEIAAEFVRRL